MTQPRDRSPEQADAAVLVVGAGPTGLTMACELARHHTDVRVIDAAPGPSRLSRAIAVHARTLEIFEDMGIAADLIGRGVKVREVRMHAGGQELVNANFDELDSHFPYLLSTPQSETEAVLRQRLAELGVHVRWGVGLQSLAQDDHGVDATLRGSDASTEKLRVRWVVGCDGAHSQTRRGVNLQFSGSTYPEVFLLADVSIDWQMPHDRIMTYFGDTGVVACFPLPGGTWRIIASDPDAGDARSVRQTAEIADPTLYEVSELFGRVTGLEATLSDPSWVARFRIHCRQVAGYRQGRVFLAGDAAHIHSPAGGQGMNAGIQDAHNLAWKLALVDQGRGEKVLLDSYQAERHHVGAAILRATDVATKVATLRHPVARAVRDRVARYLTALEPVQQRITRNVAELTISYHKSPIVDEHRPSLLGTRLGAVEAKEKPNVAAWRGFKVGPAPGDRLPECKVVRASSSRTVRLATLVGAAAHTLLLFDGRAPTEEGYRNLVEIARTVRFTYGNIINSWFIVPSGTAPVSLGSKEMILLDPAGEAEAVFGAMSECLYLVRPDLHVGFRSQPADGARLMDYLRGVLAS